MERQVEFGCRQNIVRALQQNSFTAFSKTVDRDLMGWGFKMIKKKKT